MAIIKTIGELGDTTSKTCFEGNDAKGNPVSFYFNGTTMVVEANYCID